MKTILITGGNRGLGLEFVKQYLKKSEIVIATCRNPEKADELNKLQTEFPNNLSIMQLEVDNEKSRDNLYQKLKDKNTSIDILINNAGIISGSGDRGPALGDLYTEDINKVYSVNTIAPILIAEKFLPLLKEGVNPKIVNISSMSGSITNRTRGGGYSYASSKSALNMMSKVLSNDMKEYGITVLSIHPGWVVTDMGGENAPLQPIESIEGVIGVVEKSTIEDTGKFLDWKGNELPW